MDVTRACCQMTMNSSAHVISHNVYVLFGGLRHQQGSAQTPWRERRRVRCLPLPPFDAGHRAKSALRLPSVPRSRRGSASRQ